MNKRLRRISALLPLERTIIRQYKKATRNNLRTLEISSVGTWRDQMRGEFIEWLVLEVIKKELLPIGKITFKEIAIQGPLTFDGCEFSTKIIFEKCSFFENVTLIDTKCLSLEFLSCNANAIIADRLQTRGHLRIGKSNTTEAARTTLEYLRLNGAKIDGNLDLRGCLIGTNKIGSSNPAVFADGLRVGGNTLLWDGFISWGEIRLNGSLFERNLDCSSASVINTDGYSISLAGATIQGSAYFCEPKAWSASLSRTPFYSLGTLRLDGTKIKGDLDFDAGRFICREIASNSTPPTEATTIKSELMLAIAGTGIEVGANFEFNNSNLCGSAVFINAKIAGDLNLNESHLNFAGQEAITFDSAVVDGEALLYKTWTNGILRFTQARLKQGFRVQGLVLDQSDTVFFLDDQYAAGGDLGGPACGLYAPYLSVGEVFYWKDIETVGSIHDGLASWLYLFGSRCTRLDDDMSSWQNIDRFDVTGFIFGPFLTSKVHIQSRLAELDRQYDNERFHPQPYIQLARAARDSGDNAAADIALITMEKRRTWRSDFNPAKIAWRVFLDGALKYGFAPHRILVISLTCIAISAVVFEKAYKANEIVTTSATTNKIPFNSILFAADTLIPIIDFGQRKAWSVVPPRGAENQSLDEPNSVWTELAKQLPQSFAQSLIVFNTLFGWTMATLFAASVSGLLRRAKDY